MFRPLSLWIFFQVLVVGTLAGTTVGAKEKPKSLRIEAIQLRLFSHVEGNVRAFNNPPNDYGMDMDLLVMVRVRGELEHTTKPSHLQLKISAPGWSDEATGAHKPWRLTKKTTFHRLPERGVRYFIFVVPWKDCYPKVTLTATVQGRRGGARKTKQVSLACAE